MFRKKTFAAVLAAALAAGAAALLPLVVAAPAQAAGPDCPVVGAGVAVYLPNDDDPGSFYLCDWGVPVLFHCPERLVFDKALGVCDGPKNAAARPAPHRDREADPAG
ncbi:MULTISPECIES: chitin binding peritrophin-A domain-containing protein [unclassified Streptomyces]|uniref:chitin binding peritrophin-A domain-containing protein n=1 Tax=unclassified Streptomyces TaxID=2593676 RepID=UPI00344DBC12